MAIVTAKIAREQGAKTVIIAESNASNCDSFSQEAGYETGVAALKDPAVKLLYLDGTPYKMMKPPTGLALPQYAILDIFDKVNALVSVAPTKTHMWGGTTMTMKNFIGIPANLDVLYETENVDVLDDPKALERILHFNSKETRTRYGRAMATRFARLEGPTLKVLFDVAELFEFPSLAWGTTVQRT